MAANLSDMQKAGMIPGFRYTRLITFWKPQRWHTPYVTVSVFLQKHLPMAGSL